MGPYPFADTEVPADVQLSPYKSKERYAFVSQVSRSCAMRRDAHSHGCRRIKNKTPELLELRTAVTAYKNPKKKDTPL